MNEDVATTLRYYGRSSDNAANLVLNYGLLTRLQQGCDGVCFAEFVEEMLSEKIDFVAPTWMVSTFNFYVYLRRFKLLPCIFFSNRPATRTSLEWVTI